MLATPQTLYSAAQVRELDRIAIEDCGIDGYELMCRAGRAAFRALRSRWPRARRVVVLCGGGNNGGDGYVVAALAQRDGLMVDLLPIASPKTATAGQAERDWRAAGVSAAAEIAGWDQYDVIVDAMLGTGLEREVGGRYAELIAECNQVAVPKLAIDIASGLHADTGRVLGCAVRADTTVTFIGQKMGLFTGQGPTLTGELLFDDLAVPAEAFARLAPLARIIRPDADGLRLPSRDRDAHKGSAGTAMVLGGDEGMLGAVCLAARAAYRVGAGLVRVGTRAAHAAIVTGGSAEVMSVGIERPTELDAYTAGADVIAVGPGLGQGDWGLRLFGRVLETSKALVVDADGLNLLAREPCRRDDWVLTPHPGEAARLLGVATGDVQSDRVGAVTALKERYGGVIVLKGAGTLIHDGSLWLCSGGNPGMATGGMGDVLTGIIAGLRAQGLGASAAARYGVWLHAAAGDRASAEGEIGLVASDLFPYLRPLVNGFD